MEQNKERKINVENMGLLLYSPRKKRTSSSSISSSTLPRVKFTVFGAHEATKFKRIQKIIFLMIKSYFKYSWLNTTTTTNNFKWWWGLVMVHTSFIL